MIEINATAEDDPTFVRIVESILASIIEECRPEIVCIIQIDNWFGQKWLRFSGKMIGAFGVWKKEITPPPFHPHRVKNQTVYCQGENGDYGEFEPEPLHGWQYSSDNLNRKMKQVTDSGVFAWWSSNTIANDKGSLMVYLQEHGETETWFLGFQRDEDWKVYKNVDAPHRLVDRSLRCARG